MTKAKRIFGVIFASILLLMSVVVISLYDNVRENTPRDDNLTGILEDDLQLFTIAMAKTLDSNFEAVSFDDSVDEQTRQIFLDVFDDYLKGKWQEYGLSDQYDDCLLYTSPSPRD